jgi:AraC-like DNA-binding protein
LALPCALLAAPLAQANVPLQKLLREHAESLLARLPSASLSARVVSLLSSQLSQGEPDRAQLARALNLSERTLQRRLAEEGSSYQQLLNDSRRQLAEGYLRDGRLAATEIALLLGYSEPSVFFRAFRQWTGLTPGEYRARQHPPAGE